MAGPASLELSEYAQQLLAGAFIRLCGKGGPKRAVPPSPKEPGYWEAAASLHRGSKSEEPSERLTSVYSLQLIFFLVDNPGTGEDASTHYW